MKKRLTLICLGFLFVTSFTQAESVVTPKKYGNVDIQHAIESLPEASLKALQEVRLVDNGMIGIRVFRIYGPVGKHQHQFSDTYLNIVSGRAEFAIEDGKPFEAGKGDLLFWVKGTDHRVTKILEHPLIVYAIDTPTRRHGDVLLATPK